MAKLLVCDGDSITNGYGLDPSEAWPVVIGGLLDPAWVIHNVAINGQTAGNMGIFTTDVDSLYSGSNTRNVVVCFSGTNDIYFANDADDTGATTYSHIVTYCQDRRAAGFYVIVCTLLPRNDFPGSSVLTDPQKTHAEARRTAVNTNLRANWSTFADAIADVAADSRIGDNLDENDTTYYQSDKVHPTAAGEAILASIISGAVTGFTATPSIIPANTIPANYESITLTLTGNNTAWDGTTVFTPSGLSGVTKISQNVTSATTATITLDTGGSTGVFTVTESVTGSSTTRVTVATSVTGINVGTLTITETVTGIATATVSVTIDATYSEGGGGRGMGSILQILDII